MYHLKYATENTVVSKAGVQLELVRTYEGIPSISNPICQFSYKWDFSTGYGYAHLIAIDNSLVNIVLHQTGAEGLWDFASNMQPRRYQVNGRWVVIYRVALNIDLFTGEQSAAILLNEYGSCVIGTVNFDTYCTAFTA